MSLYPTGSYITKNGERRKILGEIGLVRFISSATDFDEFDENPELLK